jgi:nucleoside-diphosphate-sugar epimerase
MDRHVVVGAGPVGTATALHLAESGREVRVVTRSGSGPVHPAVERVAGDVTEPGTLSRLAADASALYNCANPAYHRWPTDWPPLAAAFLRAAEDTGAVLVAATNVYGYGPVDHPMTENDPFRATTVKGPIRAQMWLDMLALHEAGRIRASEARSADFFGPGVVDSHIGDSNVGPILRGKPARVVGDPDTLHSWTYVPDVARTLVTLATEERAWGRPWHVPTNAPVPQREMLRRIAELAGARPPRLKPTPTWILRAVGLMDAETRELVEMTYQFDRDFVLDSSAFTKEFGIGATPLDEALAATAAWWSDHVRAAA